MSSDYWYNVRTGEIERGPQSSWSQLLGPYASAEEARNAIEQVKKNNDAWDDNDE